MKSLSFVASLIVAIAISIYIGNKHLFFVDYFMFFWVFVFISLIVTVAAMMCGASSVDEELDVDVKTLTE